MGLSEVPAVCLTDLSEAELRLLRLALNRITDDSVWDGDALALEFSGRAKWTRVAKSNFVGRHLRIPAASVIYCAAQLVHSVLTTEFKCRLCTGFGCGQGCSPREFSGFYQRQEGIGF
jgi:hypothetical protein